MKYTPFHQYFPELASKETTCITLLRGNELSLPADEYGLIELFCETADCDCRRTMLMVVSAKSKETLAVINFGWENARFYENWYGSKNKTVIDDLKGPCLNIMAPQSKYAAKILILVSSTVLKDSGYVERIQRHYKLFKDKLNPGENESKLPYMPKK